MTILCAKDKAQLDRWLRSGASLLEVLEAPRFGLVGNERFTEAARDKFEFVWTWSTFRYSGRAGQLQDRYFADHGMDGLHRRVNRVRRLLKLPPL